jgi:uncharacterized protein YkwD
VFRPRFVALTAVIAGLLSFGLSAPAQAASSTEAAIANNVLALLNSERQAHGLPALGASSALQSSARRHNLTMAAANQLSHQLPNEPDFSVRISQAGVAWHSAAENIGWTSDRTTTGARGLEISMYNEVAPNDGHRQNILSRSVRYVGIDIYLDSRTGKLWLTEDFADVAGPATASAPAAVAATPPACTLLSGGRYATYPYIAASRRGSAVYLNAMVKQNCSHGIVRSSARTIWMQRNIGGIWQNIASRMTGADGTVTLGFISAADWQYRLVVPASDNAAAGVSVPTPPPPGSIPVQGKYLSYVYIAPLRVGRAMYVNGLVKQGWPTGIIRSHGRAVFVQRNINGQWQNMVIRQTNWSGQFAVSFMAPGAYRYRLVVLPTGSAWGGSTR